MEADGNEVVRNLKYVTAYSTASYPASSRSYLSVPSSLIDQPSPQELIPQTPYSALFADGLAVWLKSTRVVVESYVAPIRLLVNSTAELGMSGPKHLGYILSGQSKDDGLTLAQYKQN